MLRFGLSALMLLIVLAGCGEDAHPVAVVARLPKSTQPWLASPIERGAQLAVDEINAAGGVDLKEGKRKLKLVVLDNASSPAPALANAREAVDRHAAVLL